MKQVVAPFLLLLAAPLAAQPALEYGSLAPFGLKTTMYTIADTASIPMLGDGAGQTWNLTGVVFTHLGSMEIKPAAGTPYSDVFPQANWVFAQTFDGQGVLYQYMRMNSSVIQMYGRNIPYNPMMYYTPTTVVEFPMAFNHTFTDSYMNESGANTRTWTYSGHGTAVTPMGTFDNVAKVKNSEGDVVLWNVNPMYPILYWEGGLIYACKLVSVNTDVGVAEAQAPSLGMWPNPCTDRLHVEGALPGSPWHVVDGQGRTVAEGALAPGQGVATGHLAPGSYLLVLEEGLHRRHLRFVKE